MTTVHIFARKDTVARTVGASAPCGEHAGPVNLGRGLSLEEPYRSLQPLLAFVAFVGKYEWIIVSKVISSQCVS